MKQRKKKALWLISFLLFLLVLTAGFFARPLLTRADESEPVFLGLHLLKGENLLLTDVEISIVVKDRNTSTVNASYEITNTGSENTSVYMAMPLTGKTMTDPSYRFTPYKYNSVLVSGDQINSMVRGISVQYDMWRAYSFEVPIEAGETKTANVSYNIENGSAQDGKMFLSIHLDHIKSWLTPPDNVSVTVSFDPKTVKPYNFDSRFEPEPTEISDQFILTWDFAEEIPANIRFQYSLLDEIIKDTLRSQGNEKLAAFVDAIESRDHGKVVELGKEYVQTAEEPKIQSMVYLLMGDSYLSLKNYTQTLAIYELLGATTTDFGGLDNPIQTKILLNRLTCLANTKDYETLYDLINFERSNTDLNYFVRNALEDAYDRIPVETLEALEEERRPPTGLELFINRFLGGEFTFFLIGIISAVLIITGLIIYFRRKRRKNNFFY